MAHTPLPIERLYLAHEITEPAFDDALESVFFARRADARRSIVRQQIATGFAESVTAEPRPAGGIGYGGGLLAVRGETLVYAGADQRLHVVDLRDASERAVTPSSEGVAVPVISPCGRYVAYLSEADDRCNILLADLRGECLPVKLTADPWYAFNPAFSPDGERIAWQEWDSLVMPWDESRIRIARFAIPLGSSRSPTEAVPLQLLATIAKPRISYAAPQWSPDGAHLAFTSDESGWRSLWVGDAQGAGASRVETSEGEIGLPDWLPGRYGYRWSGDGVAIYAVRSHRSRDTLLRIPRPGGLIEEIPSAYSDLQGLNVRGHSLVYVGTTPQSPPVLVTRIAEAGSERPGDEVARAASAVGLIDRSSLSTPELLSWKTTGGATCWGVFYPAAGADGPGEPRPLLVFMHGGPTSQHPLTWNAQAQYFATRGWHFLVVNHRGGTGYGRGYQELLQGNWGVVDLEDARSGAEHILETRGADRRRVAITGGSAGGYATLWALTQQPDFWAAGVALCPLAQIYDAVKGAHRFERHYEEGLIGRLPEAGELWVERSPLTYVDRVRAPVILFHGKEDKAVPHQQSIDFAEAVRRRGGTAELVLYDGEGHVFAKEATRRDVIERMERFLEKCVLALQR
jgi:dipeptidyl aminopeptidase/acylaminoacyl peptidase